MPPLGRRARRTAQAADEVLQTLLLQALAGVSSAVADGREASGDTVFIHAPPTEPVLAQGARARLRWQAEPDHAALAQVAWAEGPPSGDPAPLVRVSAETRDGTCLGVALIGSQRLYRVDDLRCLIDEALWAGDTVTPVVLCSDTVPRAQLRPLQAVDRQAGLARMACANPLCPSRGDVFLLPLHRFPETCMGHLPGQLPAIPCPLCPGGASDSWAMNWLGRADVEVGSRQTVLDFAVKPSVRRRSMVPGRLSSAADVPDRPSWGSVWRSSQVRALPRAAARLRAGVGRQAVLRALAQGDGAGVPLAWTLDAGNLRALVEHCRVQPAALRRTLLPALAHAYQPRRATTYRTAHDEGDADATAHHPYIAYPLPAFFDKLRFLGGLELTGRFLDVGSGVGEKPFLAYAVGAFSACDGIEFNPATVAVARYLMAGVSPDVPYPIRTLQADAFTFDGYADYDLIYMYRPLRDPVRMGQLLRHIAGHMRIGAICFDAYDSRLALRRDADDAWSTFDPERTVRAEWRVPVSPDDLIAAAGLGPAA